MNLTVKNSAILGGIILLAVFGAFKLNEFSNKAKMPRKASAD
jgi:hypothetical protein